VVALGAESGQDFHICAYADLLLVVSAARRAVPCLFWGGG
jgi:hypothetical protein